MRDAISGPPCAAAPVVTSRPSLIPHPPSPIPRPSSIIPAWHADGVAAFWLVDVVVVVVVVVVVFAVTGVCLAELRVRVMKGFGCGG